MATLQLISWDFNLKKNSGDHRTDVFETKDLICRRGQPFTIFLTFSGEMQLKDSLLLTAGTGPAPSESLQTKTVMPISSTESTLPSWSATNKSFSNHTMTLMINIPVNAVIGRYHMTLEITNGENKTPTKLQDFIVLFNPWLQGPVTSRLHRHIENTVELERKLERSLSKEVGFKWDIAALEKYLSENVTPQGLSDEVYMPSPQERQEYVLNETGLLFMGSAHNMSPKKWDFGQFQEGIVDIVFSLLKKSKDYKRHPGTEVSYRSSPIHVGRILSALVNGNDDKGVVVGNWSGDYADGVSPTLWNGSAGILRSWDQKGPVKYGQCWVYAGVLCTVLRCLGIPARVITNFSSAHDTNRNLTVDRYFNPRGGMLESEDSVWNFHAWNEGWFIRNDLGSSYSGWQILDATPQEPSGGLYRLGPASQKAIKEGDIDLEYDGPFVFAEVNADQIEWIKYDDGTTRRVHHETTSVGKLTCTKSVGEFERMDVTNEYKYEEGSAKEREIFQKAKSKLQGPFGDTLLSLNAASELQDGNGSHERDEAEAPIPDISGKFKGDEEHEFGQDFTVLLTLKNKATHNLRATVNMTATAIVYTGAPLKEIIHEAHSVFIESNEEQEIPLEITYNNYKDSFTTNMIHIVAVCEDEKAGRLLVDTVKILKSPHLTLMVSGPTILNEPSSVAIHFTNPLQEDIEGCYLTIEGSGLLKDIHIERVEPLKPNHTSITKIEITPYKSGTRHLLVSLFCKKLFEVKADQEIVVSEKSF